MPRDGISSVERRASIRATSDIELTYGSFSAVTFFTSTVSPFEADTWKQTAGVVSTGQTHSKLLSNIKRNSYFAPSALNAAAASATKKEDGAAVTSKATLSVELDLNAKTEAEEDENHDNTASYKKVREIIFGQAMRYNVTKAEQKCVNFTDVADLDDEAMENHVREDLVGRLVEGDFFKLCMLFIVFLSAIVVAVETYEELYVKGVVAFALLDNVFLGIFIMEILLKWYCNFWDYWRSGWNILDILITGSSIFKTVFPIMGKFSIFRILRVLQPFKSNSLSLLSGLQIVVTTIVDSVPDMANMAIILLVWMYIYAIVGVALFSDIIPFAFGDIGKTMYTLFISLTQIGWVEILDQLEIKGYFVEGSIYFLSFILVGVFIFMKTVVAVVVANLEEAYKNQQHLDKMRRRKLKSGSKLPPHLRNNGTVNMKADRPIVNAPEGDSDAWFYQIPFEIPDLDKISKDSLERYILVLAVIEGNLKEYARLKAQLVQIMQEVKTMNLNVKRSDSDLTESTPAAEEAAEPFRPDESQRTRSRSFFHWSSATRRPSFAPSLSGNSSGNRRESTQKKDSFSRFFQRQESVKSIPDPPPGRPAP